MNHGKLYIVSTPIGNLDDMTFRAVETLKAVDIILAEDTRHTSKLLNHFDIGTKLFSYRDQNHSKVFRKIQDFLDSGMNLALVSDSGTPLISDPGFKLVRGLRDAGYELVPIPGCSALTAALSISGIPTDAFTFWGFLPKSSGKITSILKKYSDLETTLILYESPFRVNKLLKYIVDVLGGNRMVFIGNELTKINEKCFYGKASEILETLGYTKLKGEIVVIISKQEKSSRNFD